MREREGGAHLDSVCLRGGRLRGRLRRLVPDDANSPYDMAHVVQHIVDEGELLECMPQVTALARNPSP